MELDKLLWADLLILNFPLFWCSVPAMLKGWIDRVLVSGTCYGGLRFYDRGGLAGKRALLSFSLGGQQHMFADEAAVHGAWEPMLRPLQRGTLAYVGMQVLMRRPEMGGFISISAPASHYDFGFLAPCPCNGLIFHGADDELVPEPSVRKLVDKLNTQKGITIDYRVMPGAGHVYTPDQTEKVVDAAEDHVMGVLNRGRMALAAD